MPELGRINVFFSYAHEDESYRERLEEWLSTLHDEGVISEWHDRKITPGSDWNDEITRNLEQSHVVLFLISPAFMRSEYSMGVEVKRAVALHWEKRCRVVPVILEPTPDFSKIGFGTFQALPKDAKPISQWTPPERAYADIAEGIRKICKEIVDWENPYRRARIGDWCESECAARAGPLRAKARVRAEVVGKDRHAVIVHVNSSGNGQNLDKRVSIPLDRPFEDSFHNILGQLGEQAPGTSPELAQFAQEARNSDFYREETGRGEQKLFIKGVPYYCSWLGGRITFDKGEERVISEGRTWLCIDVPCDGVVKSENRLYTQSGQLLYQATQLLTAFGHADTVQRNQETIKARSAAASEEEVGEGPAPVFPPTGEDDTGDILAQMYRLSGDDDLNSRNYDDAINFYTLATNEDPNYGVALYNRGVAKWRKRDRRGAEADIAAARAADPDLGK